VKTVAALNGSEIWQLEERQNVSHMLVTTGGFKAPQCKLTQTNSRFMTTTTTRS